MGNKSHFIIKLENIATDAWVSSEIACVEPFDLSTCLGNINITGKEFDWGNRKVFEFLERFIQLDNDINSLSVFVKSDFFDIGERIFNSISSCDTCTNKSYKREEHESFILGITLKEVIKS